MKKLLCIGLSIVLILAQCVICFGAEASDFVISTPNVMEEDGFYDSSDANTLEVNGKSVCLRKDEWVKYDISSLEAGAYSISLSAANNTNTTFDILVDEMLKKGTASITASGEDYSVSLNRNLGAIQIPENAKTLKIKNAVNPVYISNIVLKPLGDKDIAVEAMNIKSLVKNDGFFDAGETFVPGSGCAILHQNDWVKYVVNAAAGTYKLKMNVGTKNGTAIFNVFANEDLKFSQLNIAKTGDSYTPCVENEAGYIYLPEGTSEIKIVNAGNNAAYFDDFYLEYVSDTNAVVYANSYNNHNNASLDANHAVLHVNDWTAYDVSSFPEGLYSLKLLHGNTSASGISVLLNDVAKLDVSFPSTTAYKMQKETDLGLINLPAGTKTLKLLNNKAAALYAWQFALIPVDNTTLIDARNKTDYYDNSGNNTFETRGTVGGVCLRAGEWVEYDISSLKSGAYEIAARMANSMQVSLDVSLDNVVKTGTSVAGSDSYTYLYDVKLGMVNISEDNTSLRITNTSSNALYYDFLSLKYLGEGTYIKNATDIKNNISGEGFVDGGNEDKFEIDAGSRSVIFRKYDQAKYEMPVEAGWYVVKAVLGNTNATAIEFKVNDGEWKNVQVTTTTTSYTSMREIELGKVYLSGTSDFTISNPNTYASYIKTIVLESLGKAENNLYFSSDEAGENEIEAFEGLEKIYLNGKIENYHDGNAADVIIAQYDVDTNRLITCEVLTLDKTHDYILVNEEIVIDDETSEIKVFVWNSVGEMRPAFGTTDIKKKNKVKSIYVSAQNGNDNNDGTENAPLQSIEKAQSYARKIAAQNMNVEVVLEGDFELDDTLTFTEADSAQNGTSVVYNGKGNTTISGGKKVTGWEPVTDTPLYKTQIDNIDDFRHFYVNGNRGVRARSKWLYFAKDSYNDQSYTGTSSDVDGFVLDKNDFPNEFKNPTDMEFVWMVSWKNIRMPVYDWFVNSDGDYVAVFPQPYFDTARPCVNQTGPELSTPFYIENAPEFLDEAGEWYFDKETKTLYYYPFEYEDMDEADCYIPVVEKLLDISGTDDSNKVRNITFKGIEFKYGAWEQPTHKGFTLIQAEQFYDVDSPLASLDDGRQYPTRLIPAQIQVNFGDNINFTGNKFLHMGSVALSYNNQTTNSVIEGNIFDDLSSASVTFGDCKMSVDTPLEEFCRNITFSNNLIRRPSVEYFSPAVTAYYVENVKISNNDIKDAPYTGISLGWGWGRGVKYNINNEVSNNKIENVMYRLKDGGHIYTLDEMEGTNIFGNHLIKSGEWKGGIYLDNASAYLSIYDNVFEDCEKWLKLTYENIHDNTAYNNYSDSDYVVSYPEQNSLDPAINKTEGIWSEEAQAIIDNAGLTDSYNRLYTYENGIDLLRNPSLYDFKYIAKNGIIVQGGDVKSGGEGVAYHDIVQSEFDGGIGITDEYNGTKHKYLMATSQGEWTKYNLNVEQNGFYNIYLCAATRFDNVVARVNVDNVFGDYDVTIKNNGSYSFSSFVEHDVATVYLTKGNHEIKVEQLAGNFGLYYLRAEKNDSDEFNRNDGFLAGIMSEFN